MPLQQLQHTVSDDYNNLEKFRNIRCYLIWIVIITLILYPILWLGSFVRWNWRKCWHPDTATWPISFTLQSAAKLNDLVVHHNKLMNGDRLENPICFPHPKQHDSNLIFCCLLGLDFWITPQKSKIDTRNGHILKRSTFSKKPSPFGVSSRLFFFGCKTNHLLLKKTHVIAARNWPPMFSKVEINVVFQSSEVSSEVISRWGS